MTWLWDEVTEFLENLGTLKDPELFETGISYVRGLFGEIHTIDHRMGERIAKGLKHTRALKAIEDFNRKVKGAGH